MDDATSPPQVDVDDSATFFCQKCQVHLRLQRLAAHADWHFESEAHLSDAEAAIVAKEMAHPGTPEQSETNHGVKHSSGARVSWSEPVSSSARVHTDDNDDDDDDDDGENARSTRSARRQATQLSTSTNSNNTAHSPPIDSLTPLQSTDDTEQQQESEWQVCRTNSFIQLDF